MAWMDGADASMSRPNRRCPHKSASGRVFMNQQREEFAQRVTRHSVAGVARILVPMPDICKAAGNIPVR